MPCAKILIVDDSAEVREFCRMILGDKYELAFATSGDEADERLAADKPDLILLDIYLPRVDWLMLAEKYKANPELSHIPIVMMSGLMADSYLPGGFWKMATPAQGYLHKPVEPAVLLAEVERQLASARGIDTSDNQTGGYL